MRILTAFVLTLFASLAFGQAQQSVPNGTVQGNFSGVQAIPKPVSSVLISSGTAGGVLGFSNSTTLTSSANLGFPFNPGSGTNTVFGISAGTSLSGINSTAFGNSALSHATTGNSNTAFGQNAGVWVSTSGSNTAVGSSAILGISGAPLTGGGNTATGAAAGGALQGAASNNSLYGSNTGSSITTGTFNQIFGNAVCSSGCATIANVDMIGNTINCLPSSSSATNEFDICGSSTTWLQVTGTNTPTTSQAGFFGLVGAGGPAGLTIGTLPTCNTARQGMFTYVTNAQTTPTYLGTVSTTGAVIAPVFCNGTGWVYH